jgi:hypothetical protein
MMLGLAEQEIEERTNNWEEADRRAIKRGAFVAPTPFGYRRRSDGRLEPTQKRPRS